MKKRISIALISILCCVMCACNKEATTNSNTLSVEEKKENAYVSQPVSIDDRNMNDFMCIKDNKIIYVKYENTEWVFYKYDIEQNVTHKIGAVENPYLASLDAVETEDKVFFYCNELIVDSGNFSGKVENSLYEIDIAKNELKKVATDSTEQVLIYVDELDGNVISYKGIIDGKQGISYLDVIGNTEKDNGSFDILLSKKYDREEKCGEGIYNFTVSNSTIYVLNCKKDAQKETVYVIEKYDSNGKYIGELSIDEEIIKLIENDRVATFEIYGEYGFIGTFSNGGVLFNISSNEIVPMLLNETDIDIANFTSSEEAENMILYSRATGEIWNMDIKDGCLNKLDSPYNHLGYIYADNEIVILSVDGNTVYGDINMIIEQKEE